MNNTDKSLDSKTAKPKNPYGFILDTDNETLTPPKTKLLPKRGKLLVVLLAVLLPLVALLSIQSQESSETTTISQTSSADYIKLLDFDDPLFSMKVPAVWLPSQDYRPGSGLVFLSGPATHTAAPDTEDITMTVEIMPQEVSGEEYSAVNGELVTEESYTLDGVEYRYAAHRVTSQPDNESYTEVVAHNIAVKDGQILVARVSVPADAWEHYQQLIGTSLRSLRLK